MRGVCGTELMDEERDICVKFSCEGLLEVDSGELVFVGLCVSEGGDCPLLYC